MKGPVAAARAVVFGIIVWAWIGFIVLLALSEFASGSVLAAILLVGAGLLVFPPLSKWFAADDVPPGVRVIASVVLAVIGLIVGAWSTSPAVAECVEAKIEYFRAIGSYPTLSDGRDAYAVAREQCSNSTHRAWVKRNRDSF